MNAQEAAALIDAIASGAPRLREAGVVGEVRIGDVSFMIGQGDTAPAPPADRPSLDALNDPATHGQFGPGAADRVPRYRRTPLVGGDG